MPLKGRTGNAKFPKSNTKGLFVYRSKRTGSTQAEEPKAQCKSINEQENTNL